MEIEMRKDELVKIKLYEKITDKFLIIIIIFSSINKLLLYLLIYNINYILSFI
jgi:hypothetical protein